MKNNFPSRKDNIVLTAIEIINDLGIQGLSTKELAKRQAITESLLYRYFRSKDEIIVAVLENFSRFDQSIHKTIGNASTTAKEKILEYFRLYTEYYENYPAIIAVMLSFNEFAHDPKTHPIVVDIFNNRNAFLSETIHFGQKKGEIGYYFSSEELTEILSGFFKNVAFIWRLKEYSFSLKDHTLTAVQKILDNQIMNK
ncbi:TetR/AcrR family transcriptional regulator [Dehalobacter sp. DCM]|uniref:TetR/AcrR family transcriptional regulator n=1 Tax=Dehalobacter sp. DCM TaxID=2907827 RepID=UPI003081245C|nr:TetR/AcrR family transcriptional regulator [Dehalobacter sp. DCM]